MANSKSNKKSTTPARKPAVENIDPRLVIEQITVGIMERGNQTIKTWFNNVKAAENQIFPDRRFLYNTYHDVTIDLHLDMLLEKRARALLTVPWEWPDLTNDIIKENFKSPWFFELLRLLGSRYAYGTTLGEVQLNTWDGLINDIELIPRQNVSPERGIIMTDGFTDGANAIRYREGIYSNYILEIGRKRDIGKLAKLSPYVLMKRQNFSDFSRYNEMYGIDLRVYEYDPLKPTARAEAEKSAKEYGSAAYIVVPKGYANVVFPQTSNKQASAFAFDKLHSICNDEMTTGVLGQSLTTGGENGGSYELGKVHMSVAEMISMEERMIAEYIINYPFKNNILIPHGYPLADQKGQFKVPDALPKEMKANMWIAINGAGVPIAEEDFYNEFGIPFPNGRPVVVPPSKPDPDPAAIDPNNPQPPKPGKQKEKPAGGPGKKKDLTAQLNALYAHRCERDKSPGRVSLSYQSDLDKIITNIIEQIKNGALKAGDIDPALYDLVAKELWKGVQKGYGTTLAKAEGADIGMLKALRTNVYRFSGFKTYNFVRQANDLLVDEAGIVKPFAKFRDDVLALNKLYNVNHLRTEYTHAIAASDSASRWQDFQNDKQALPMLEIDVVTDDRTRHRQYDKIRRPVDDEFWDRMGTTPFDWGCRCLIKQVADGEPTDLSSFKYPQHKPGFGVNWGKKAVVFPEDHPQFTVDPADQKNADKNFGLPIPE